MDAMIAAAVGRWQTKSIKVLSLSLIALLVVTCTRKPEPIKVGFVGGLTGRTSDLGISARNGVVLAVEEQNAAGGVAGRPIVLITKDDQQDPESALKVDLELIQEGAVAIIGHLTSQMSVEAVPLVNQRHIVMLSPTTSTSQLAGKDDYFIRVIVSVDDSIRHLAGYAFHDLGLTRVVVAYDTSNRSFTEEYFTIFNSTYESMGAGQVIPEAFESGSTNGFADIAERILAEAPEGIVIAANALDTAILCQQIRQHNATVRLLASGWAYTSDFLQHGGPAVEGVIFPQWYDPQSGSPSFKAFATRYEARYGKFPNFASMFGYDAAKVLIEALHITQDPARLKAVILDQGTFKGLQGEIRIDRFGDARRKFYLFIVHNGKFEVLRTP